MNEQLQQALSAILNKTMSGVDAGISFLSAEIPDVIHQLLMWKMIQSMLFFVFGIIVICWTIVFIKRQYRRSVEKTDNYGQVYYVPTMVFDNRGEVSPGCVIFAVLALAGILTGVSLISGLSWLQILIAPKIYLIEYAASLAK